MLPLRRSSVTPRTPWLDGVQALRQVPLEASHMTYIAVLMMAGMNLTTNLVSLLGFKYITPIC